MSGTELLDDGGAAPEAIASDSHERHEELLKYHRRNGPACSTLQGCSSPNGGGRSWVAT